MTRRGSLLLALALGACSAPQPARPAPVEPTPAPVEPPPAVDVGVAAVDAVAEVGAVPATDAAVVSLDVPMPADVSPRERLVRAVAGGAVAAADATDAAAGFRSLAFSPFPPRGMATSSGAWGTCGVLSETTSRQLREELVQVVTLLDGGAPFACTGEECVVRRGQEALAWYLRFASGDGGALRLMALAHANDAGHAGWVARVRSRVDAHARAHPCRR